MCVCVHECVVWVVNSNALRLLSPPHWHNFISGALALQLLKPFLKRIKTLMSNKCDCHRAARGGISGDRNPSYRESALRIMYAFELSNVLSFVMFFNHDVIEVVSRALYEKGLNVSQLTQRCSL